MELMHYINEMSVDINKLYYIRVTVGKWIFIGVYPGH